MKMRKVLPILLTVAMVAGLVGCGGGSGSGSSSSGGSTTSGSSTADTSAVSGSSAETESTSGTETESTSTASGSSESRPNRVIYGSSTGISGDLSDVAWWTNNADDAHVRDLINDYSVVAYDQEGQMLVNPTVVDGEIESVDNEDGSKTFTVKINEGLTYNNGEAITAADYCAYWLIALSPAMLEAGGSAVADTVVGGPEYQKGEATVLSGLHLVDEYTYSITISPDYIPYYFELTYASAIPLYLPQYASAELTVTDDGEGAYLAGGSLTAEEIDATRYRYDESRVSAGPYQIVSVDEGAVECVLEINPNYAGNFEGQKPSIEQIVMVKTNKDTVIDALKTGSIDILDTLTDGANEINPALDLVDEGGFDYISFDRAGYGKIQFQCDFGPTQFVAVRQAIALLLDRNEFANQFCAGYGSVVNGPYGIAAWMYQESEEYFAETLNSYDYNPEQAVALLEEDGWTLNADGTPYSGTGLRYKEVTAEEAGDYAGNVTLDDGRILMPLHIMWASSEDNAVSELLVVMLANGDQVADAGMEIEQTVMTFDELLLYMYRDATSGDQYGVPTYGMYNLATNFTQNYDMSYSYSLDPQYLGTYNNNFIFDEELDQLSMDMVYGVEPGDDATYLDLFQKFIVRFNTLLPDIPLYSNIYYTVYADWVQGLEENSLWDFSSAILYATVEGAE